MEETFVVADIGEGGDFSRGGEGDKRDN